jgi:LacI family transcriptional regulator
MADKRVVTLKDISERVGVNITAVSMVLNGNRSSARVSEATRQRIRAEAARMGYRPNHLARSLVKQKTETIGLLLSDFGNPFFQEVYGELEKRTVAAGFQVLLDPGTGTYGRYHELRKIASWMVDGALIWTIPDYDLELYLGERARDIPTVYLGHPREDGRDSVAVDLRQAGRLATEHLIERGRRRLCFVSTFPPENFQWPSHQQIGYQNNQLIVFQEICREAGIAPEVFVLDDVATRPASAFSAGLALARRPAAQRPDGLICHNDWIAHFVILGLMQGGVRAPEDIAVVGFDGIEECKHIPNGPLTTVRAPVAELCQTALDILLMRIGGDVATPPQQVLLPADLIVGGTT